jgi:tetratricopeptide (TPR) repeat protein
MSPDPAQSAGRASAWVAAAVLFALGFALYARTLGYEFVNWDDPAEVVENPWIRAVTLENLESIFSEPILDAYFPLMTVSFMVDHALWGLDPRGFHLQSVLLNALNGALAFWVIAQLTRRRALAFVAALLWCVHHTHVESVAWVSARKEVLATSLLLGSLGFFLRAREAVPLRRGAYVASIALFGLAAAAKLTIGSYALFFALADWSLRERRAPQAREPLWRHVAIALPHVFAALPVVIMNSVVQHTILTPEQLGLFDYVLVRGQAAWRYLWLLLGLLPGQPLYDLPPISHQPVLVATTLFPLLAPLAAFAFALRRKYTNAALALAWLMLGLLAPLVFPLVTYMADRYLYAPSLGFCWLLASGIAALAFAPSRSRVWNAATAVLLTAPPLLWFALLAWSATPVWRNSEALWTRAVATSRDGRAFDALAIVLARDGRTEEAERVLRSGPATARGYTELAIAYAGQKRIHDALRATDGGIEATRTQVLLRPQDGAMLYSVRGSVLWLLGRSADATGAWHEALAIDPAEPVARAALRAIERGEDPGAAIQPPP